MNTKSIFEATEEAAMPYNVISRVDIDRMGATSMEELFRNVPEATNYGNVLQSAVGNTQVTGGQTYSTAAINLRGFGTTQTIVLINGRRLGQGSNVGGPDISRIPIGSIERIEILPAAAAAIYGGGAVGGAVNIILRKNFSGRDISTYFGTATAGGGTEFRTTLLEGRTLNGGKTRLTATLDYNTRRPVFMNQRDYLQRAYDKYGPTTTYRSTTGVSLYETFTLRAYAGMPGTIVASNPTGGLGIPGNPNARYAAIPAGLTSAQANALTPASFNTTAGSANLEPRYNRSILYRPQDNYSVQLQVEHDFIPDRLSFYAEANASYQRQNYEFPQSFSLSLAANHPFNPFRTGVTPGFAGVPIVVMMDTPDITDPSSLQERNDARLTLGLKGKINEDWEWTLDGSAQYQRLYSDAYNPSNYLQSLLQTVTLTGAGAAPLATRWNTYNPLMDHDLYPISRVDHDSLFYYNRQNAHYNRNAQVAARVVGDVWQLPGGPLRVSPGADLRFDQRHGFQYIPGSERMLQLTGFTVGAPSRTPLSDTILGAYLETTVPIIGKRFKPIPFVESFEIGASRRWDQSNHARNTVSNTVSGSSWIGKSIMLRASLTEGFVPLDRTHLTDPVIATNVNQTFADPMRGNTSQLVTIPTYITGGNPEYLRTEFARTRNFGFVLKPRVLDGLTVNVNYFMTKRFDTPATPTLADVLSFPQDYPGRAERAPLTAADISSGYTGGAITVLNLTRINLAAVEQDGFDYRITYRLPLNAERYGRLTWNTNVTQYNSHRTRVRNSSPAVNQVDVQNQPMRWRGNSSVFWEKDRWMAGVTANYINSYYGSTTQPTPALPTATGIDGRKIPHSLLFDLQIGYKFPAGALRGNRWKEVFNATEFRLGVLNVLDRDPPLFTDSTGLYSRYNDPRQRFVYLQVKKTL
ncbi:MAG: TonB-dependent receptor plug domain-containing protein [Opitutaceae bacterium]|nr:TonB-dependent receptor plug domain-containing protein [Opitutaceae bacterium]